MGNKSGNCYNSTPNEDLIEISNREPEYIPMKRTVNTEPQMVQQLSEVNNQEPEIEIEKFESITLDNGKKITGSMINGKIRQGVIDYPNGDRYQGEILQDCAFGEGEMNYSNGDWYKGQFDEDLRSGYGELCFDSGNIYKGDFSQNVFHGNGNFIFNNGNFFQGILIDFEKIN